MIQVSYVSRSTMPMSSGDLLALLHQCRRNNTEQGVSGLLLYGNGTFLQTIEGEPEVVDPLYARIFDDPRHADIELLYRKEIPERQYSEWSMGFDEVSDESLKDIEGLRDFGAVDFNFSNLTGNREVVETLLEHYREPHYDQILGELDAKDRVIAHLERTISTMRDHAALARLALESLTEASRQGQPNDALLDLCESSLKALRRQ
jgi:hypothetical protein